jgi:hypothetical protein
MVSITYPSREAGVSITYALPSTGYIAPTEDQAARLLRIVDAACPWLALAASTDLAEFRRAFNATGLMFRRSEPDTRHSFSHFIDAANDMLAQRNWGRGGQRGRAASRDHRPRGYAVSARRSWLRTIARGRSRRSSRPTVPEPLARPSDGRAQPVAEPPAARRSRAGRRRSATGVVPSATTGRLLSSTRRQRTTLESKLNTRTLTVSHITVGSGAGAPLRVTEPDKLAVSSPAPLVRRPFTNPGRFLALFGRAMRVGGGSSLHASEAGERWGEVLLPRGPLLAGAPLERNRDRQH